MIQIPDHIQELKSYNPGKTIEEYRTEFGFTNTAILWNNENNLGVPPKAMEAMAEAARGVNVYPDPLSVNLRAELAKLNDVDADCITVENGSESILANLFKAFIQPDEYLLTSEGTFVAVYIWAKSANREARTIPLNTNYAFDLDAIKGAITDKTKVVYLSNPNNPTGTMFSKRELDAFLKGIPEHVIVVVDEAYFEYATLLRGDYPDSTKLEHPQLITLRTFSKAYGLAGVRLGYAVGPKQLIEALNKVRMTFAPSAVTQAAGIGALQDKRFLEQTLRLNYEAVTDFNNFFDELGVKRAETAGNFVMIDTQSAEKAEQLTSDLLRKGVFVRWLRAFGLPSCIRISTGRNDENQYFKEMFRRVW
jgi:histidinol-phosphate aminotransferase